MIQLEPSKFAGIKIFEREIFRSDLGFFTNLFHFNFVDDIFIQDSVSFSKETGTVRGLHFQSPPAAQSKLINVLQGGILDFFLDLRPESETFLRHGSINLNQENAKTLYIPRGFAHGFITLKNNTIVSYKLDNEYNPDMENTIIWNDPEIDIKWPLMKKYFHSPKDLDGRSLSEILEQDLHR